MLGYRFFGVAAKRIFHLRIPNPQGEPETVEVEEIQFRTLPAHSALHLSNPYEAEPISFLHVWIKVGEDL
ncbi:hypothetical protein [Hymenobacter jejuensis]|uniref:Uncharacterized protein n=1 Tax=Hymenobacter jejuensis TaxID=2502781 RepID=A0A5B7ZZX1_9BACT|nr:hypothetical protein [Hymenobacter jejuensis]QDA59422.1 hypothetical protein FHG12_04580 [Hymenobacter jejuensis]